MGLDTVELKGAPFTIKVKVGDKVTPTTELAEMDLDAVKAAGKETDIITVLTNADKVQSLDLKDVGEGSASREIGSVKVK